VPTDAISHLWPNQVDFPVGLLLRIAELQATAVPSDWVRRFREAGSAAIRRPVSFA